MKLLALLFACGSPGDADTGAPPAAECSEGLDVGSCPPDVTVFDTEDVATGLLSLRGLVTVYTSEAMWCASCQAQAQGLDALGVDRGDDGVVVISVLIQDVDGNPPVGDDAGQWADVLELKGPVMADSDGAFFATYGEEVNPFVFYVLDADGAIVWRAPQETTSTLQDVITAVDGALTNSL